MHQPRSTHPTAPTTRGCPLAIDPSTPSWHLPCPNHFTRKAPEGVYALEQSSCVSKSVKLTPGPEPHRIPAEALQLKFHPCTLQRTRAWSELARRTSYDVFSVLVAPTAIRYRQYPSAVPAASTIINRHSLRQLSKPSTACDAADHDVDRKRLEVEWEAQTRMTLCSVESPAPGHYTVEDATAQVGPLGELYPPGGIWDTLRGSPPFWWAVAWLECRYSPIGRTGECPALRVQWSTYTSEYCLPPAAWRDEGRHQISSKLQSLSQ